MSLAGPGDFSAGARKLLIFVEFLHDNMRSNKNVHLNVSGEGGKQVNNGAQVVLNLEKS